MLKKTILFFSILTACRAFTQEKKIDSIVPMGEVVVKGFETNRNVLHVPASISVLGPSDLNRFSNNSLVPVMNTVPGVRMEERSPASYRLSIRGSLLRSPFGVRNVKIYWNDLALTDAGGNSYLNLVDLSGVGRLELIKGPAGSIYGAGTGGVVIMQPPQNRALKDSTPRNWEQNFAMQLSGGSYGLFNEQFRWQATTRKAEWEFVQSHLQADGYRSNSRLRRENLQASGSVLTSKNNRIDALLLLSDLYYQTPGGLTLKQMEENPRQSRPATPTVPSASEQRAAVYNRSVFGGLSNNFFISPHWSNISSIFGMMTDFKNPFLTNYEHRTENSLGVRSKLIYDANRSRSIFRLILGLEWQSTWSQIDSSGNIKGAPDDNLVRDKVESNQQFYFTQAEWQVTPALLLQGGASLNFYSYDLQRVIPAPPGPDIPVNFDAQVVPRMALLYSFNPSFTAHFSASKGFSPPGLAEIRPSAGGFYTDLQAEYGWNYEFGLKGALLHNRFQFDLALFDFNLKDAIVRRTDSVGAEYFVNAGGTKQRGIELWVNWFPIRNPQAGAIEQLRIWSSATFYDFLFSNYKVNDTEYSGNELTGVPRKVWVSGFDIDFLQHFFWNQTINYTSKLPLNDANDTYADAYVLVQSKFGWRNASVSRIIELFGGLDNILNETYSLGNDLNAFGKRYYNPAAKLNFYVGIKFQF